MEAAQIEISAGILSRASSTAAAPVARGRRPMYRSWVIDTLLCPNWSAAARAVSPAESIRLATVFRKMWDVSPGRPISAKASRMPRRVLAGSRRLCERGAGNTNGQRSVRSPSRRRSMSTAHVGSPRIRSPASDFGEGLRMRPWPLMRSTVPMTSAVPIGRLTSCHRTAHASPILRPVASMKSTDLVGPGQRPCGLGQAMPEPHGFRQVLGNGATFSAWY